MKRPRYPMPDYFYKTLEHNGLVWKYVERPPYQQNDYIGWIEKAKLPKTKEKRINQMLEELKTGGLYMKMRWNWK